MTELTSFWGLAELVHEGQWVLDKIQDSQKRACETQQLTKAIETKVHQVSSQIHHLKNKTQNLSIQLQGTEVLRPFGFLFDFYFTSSVSSFLSLSPNGKGWLTTSLRYSSTNSMVGANFLFISSLEVSVDSYSNLWKQSTSSRDNSRRCAGV